jgi:hypothetical protein
MGEIEDHGLFGSISAVPDSGSTMILMTMALTAILGGSRFWLARSTH